MTFTVELEYVEGCPDEQKEGELYPIEVPALPPEGTIVNLHRAIDDIDVYFAVEVVGKPELFAEFADEEAGYLLKVKPFPTD